MLRKAFLWTAGALAAVLAVGVGVYLRDLHRAYDRIRGPREIVASPFGAIEFRQGGEGVPVLVIHGSGGGFDQGELVAGIVLGDNVLGDDLLGDDALGDDVHWIAPSRFGYLGSAMPADASFDDQADAYVHLLDALDLDRVAVVALSHGGPSALLLAVRHPERVASLTLISAGVASSTDPAQAAANDQGAALATIFRHDALYWLVTRVTRRRLLALMGADEAVTASLTPAQRRLVDEVVDSMNPVSPRAAGVALDHRAPMPDDRIAAIRAPTLVLHARDDTLQLHHNAEFAAATIPGARLVSFDRGGHLLLVVEQPTVRTLVREHVLTHPVED